MNKTVRSFMAELSATWLKRRRAGKADRRAEPPKARSAPPFEPAQTERPAYRPKPPSTRGLASNM